MRDTQADKDKKIQLAEEDRLSAANALKEFMQTNTLEIKTPVGWKKVLKNPDLLGDYNSLQKKVTETQQKLDKLKAANGEAKTLLLADLMPGTKKTKATTPTTTKKRPSKGKRH